MARRKAKGKGVTSEVLRRGTLDSHELPSPGHREGRSNIRGSPSKTSEGIELMEDEGRGRGLSSQGKTNRRQIRQDRHVKTLKCSKKRRNPKEAARKSKD